MKPILTLLSDYGLTDHYVAAIKAQILSSISTQPMVDISHQINNCDIAQAAFLLSSVYRDFPEGSVHLVAVNAAGNTQTEHLAFSANGHFFIGPNNGLFSLVKDLAPNSVFQLLGSGNISLNFPAKSVYAPAAVHLLLGKPLEEIGPRLETFSTKYSAVPKTGSDFIKGQVLHVDHYGNLITNISSSCFQNTAAERRFSIAFEYELVQSFDLGYESKDYGDCVVFFNSLDYLEIAINHGNAAQLLGMQRGSAIHVSFFS